MPQIKVQTPELALAASAIGSTSADVQSAQSSIGSAQAEAGAFGGEPIGAAFLNMCSQASRATAEYGQVVSELSQNVAMAALGYVNTDEGVIPVSSLGEAGKQP